MKNSGGSALELVLGDLAQWESADEVEEGLSRFLGAYGIHSFTAALIDAWKGPGQAPSVQWLMKFDPSFADESWASHYLESGYEAHDYGLRVHGVEKRTEPFAIGVGFDGKLDGITKEESEVYRGCAEAGLVSGAVVPLVARAGSKDIPHGYSIWSGMDGHEFTKLMADHGPTIRLVLYAAKDRVMPALRAASLGVEPLAPRERDCLLYTAQGLRADQIADKLGIATVTANLHLRNARRKLQSRTTAEAVARALVCDLIQV